MNSTFTSKELPNFNDETLIKICLSTSNQKLIKECFGYIAHNNYNPLKVYLRRLVSADDIEDVVQNTMLKAYENLSSFNKDSTVSTWLCAIAYNNAMNLYRDSSRQPPDQDVDYEDALAYNEPNEEGWEGLKDQIVEAFTDHNTPEAIYIAEELLEVVQDTVETLDEKYQVLFDLRYVEQMDYQEIADALELSIGTVKKRMHDLNIIIQEVIKNNS